MKLSRVALGFVAALCLPQAVLAWNGTGHELVAAIAWDNMTPEARQKAFDILNAASNHICLRELFPAGDLSTPEQQRQAFIIAATWPDHIRSGPCEATLSHKPWHFTDHFWKGVSGDSAHPPQTVTTLQPGSQNAVERLILFRPVVACPTPPCAAADERAEDLAWTLHLVGDIHQPLHSASRVTADNPDGDGGGNAFFLSAGTSKRLHSYWDGIIDTAFPRNANESFGAYLTRAEAKIVNDHPAASMAARLKSGDFAAWSDEGFQAAEQVVYPATLKNHQPPPPGYQDTAFKTAAEEIAIGGYRLADLLNTRLGGQTPPPPPPPPPASPQPLIPSGQLPAPSHIVIVIDENKGFGNIIGSGKAKYINELAARGASLTKFYASHHPSQPNYVDFFAGDTLGVCDDTCTTTPFTAQNLGAALIAAGKSFTGFAENLPPNASTVCKAGKFARKHTPWLDFSNVPSTSSKRFSDFPQDAAGFATLPDVSLVIPNLVNDMHNGSAIGAEVKAGDDWLRQNLSAYADWAETNNSLLIVTWDEDSSSYTINCANGVITTQPPKNHIATIVMGQPVVAGTKSTTTYTHADLLRTILDIYGITPFGNAATANDITGIWK